MRFQPLCCQNMRTISAAGAAGGALALAPPPGSRAGRPFGEPRELLGVPVRSDARGTARAPPAPAQHFSAKISLFSMCRGRSKREASDVLSAKGGRAKKAAAMPCYNSPRQKPPSVLGRSPNQRDAAPRVRRADDRSASTTRRRRPSPITRVPRRQAASPPRQKSQAGKPFLVCCCCPLSFVCSQMTNKNLRLSTQCIKKQEPGNAAAATAAGERRRQGSSSSKGSTTCTDDTQTGILGEQQKQQTQQQQQQQIQQQMQQQQQQQMQQQQ